MSMARTAAVVPSSSGGVKRLRPRRYFPAYAPSVCCQDRHDPRLLRHQPGQRDLPASRGFARHPVAQQRHQRKVRGQVRKARSASRCRECRPRRSGCGRRWRRSGSRHKRAPRDKPDAEFLAERDQFRLRPAPEHRIFVLHGRDGQFRMGAAQGARPISDSPNAAPCP